MLFADALLSNGTLEDQIDAIVLAGRCRSLGLLREIADKKIFFGRDRDAQHSLANYDLLPNTLDDGVRTVEHS